MPDVSTALRCARHDKGRVAGFTLIELLVVISVIALLISILLPSLQRVHRQGKALGCQANLRQWGTYYSTAIAEGDAEAFPAVFWDDFSRDYGSNWVLTLERRYGSHAHDLLLCPMAPRPNPKDVKRPPAEGLIAGGNGSTFFAWWGADYKGPVCTGSYAMNFIGLLDVFPGTFMYEHKMNTEKRNIGRDRIPLWDSGMAGAVRASVPIMFDCAQQQWGYPQLGPPPFEDFCGPEDADAVCMNRHDGTVNYLFLDWSVRKVGLKEIWTLKWDTQYNTCGPWTKAGGVKPEDWPPWLRRLKDY